MGTIEAFVAKTDYTGKILGGVYRLDSFLGHGGFGEVWRGTDTRSGTCVAVKLLPAGVEKTEKFLDQLEHECRILIELSHPHICRMLDFIRDRDLGVALVTEFVDGADIYKVCTPETIGPLIAQLLQALAYLHGKNVYHFDIKPGNVLVTNGAVKLIDFGLSSLFPERKKAGTPSYMAPEIFENESAKDERTELYAVGALWLICLTRLNPFRGASMDDTWRRHTEWRPHPLLEKLPGGTAIVKLLEVDPAKRFQSASEVLDALKFRFRGGVTLTEEVADAYGGAGGKFIGRGDIVEKVVAWSKLEGPGQALWLTVSGDRGCGKSRLLTHCKLKAQSEKCRSIEIHSADQITLESLKPLSDSLADKCLPLLITLDDYDRWAGKLSADPLRRLLDALQRHPHPPTRVFCFISCTDLREVPYHYSRIPLNPFTETEVAQFLEAVARMPVAKCRDLAHRLWQKTGGNPGLLTRLMTALTRQGLLVSESGRWDEHLFEDISIDIPEYSLNAGTVVEASPREILAQCREDRQTGHPLRALDRLLHCTHMNEDLLLEMVECAISTGKAEEVITLIQKHLDHMPRKARLLYQLGILHMVQNEHETARGVLQTALAQAHDNAALSISIRNQLARCDMLQGKYVQAIAQFRKTRRDEARLKVEGLVFNNELGYALLLAKRPKEASKILEEDIRQYKRLGHVRRLLQALLWHGKVNKNSIARHDYEQVAAMAREHQELKVLGESYNELAGLMLQERDIKKGMEFYRKALSLHYTLHQLPGAAVILNSQGLCLLSEEKWSDAKYRFETAMEYLKDAPEAWRGNLVQSYLGLAEICRHDDSTLDEAEAKLDLADNAANQYGVWEQNAYALLMTRAQVRQKKGKVAAARDLALQAKPFAATAPQREEWEGFMKSCKI